MVQKDLKLTDIIKQLLERRKYILGITFLTAVGTAIISLLLPVYYQASTLFYAASPDLASPEQIFGEANTTTRYYGTDSDRDRLFSIAGSSVVTDFLIQKFGLYERYDIDSTHVKAPYHVKQQLLDLYTVEKTKYDALELSVEDQDPQIAAEMANAARERINEEAQRLILESQQKMLNTYQKAIEEQSAYLKVLEDSLRLMRSTYGVYNTESQSEQLSNQLASEKRQLSFDKARLKRYLEMGGAPRDTIRYLQAAIAGREQSLQEVESRLEKFSQGMSRIEMLETTYEEISDKLSELQTRKNQLQTALQSGFTALHIVETAQVPTVKSRPKRSILVIMAAMAAFMFSVLGVLLYENYKDDFQ